jgi:hypothetical protein
LAKDRPREIAKTGTGTFRISPPFLAGLQGQKQNAVGVAVSAIELLLAAIVASLRMQATRVPTKTIARIFMESNAGNRPRGDAMSA